MFLYQVEELSDRALPFLLFNLALRGMNASVVHGDVLSRRAKGAFFVQNERDNHLGFSAIYTMPYDEACADYFAVTWTDALSERHDPIDAVGDWPAHLGGNTFLDAVKGAQAGVVIDTCGKCGAAFTDDVTAYDYSPDLGDICAGCAEVVAE